MAANQRKGLAYITDITAADQLAQAFKDAKATVRHQANIEKAVMRSSGVLFASPEAGTKQLAAYEPLIEARAAALMNEVQVTFKLAAATWKTAATEPLPTDLEKLAARLVVERVPPPPGTAGGPGGGFGGGGFGGPQNREVAAAMQKIPQHMRSEINPLLGRKMTAMEIRDFLTGEFEPVPLDDVMNYLRAAEKAGTIRLTERVEPARPGARAKKP